VVRELKLRVYARAGIPCVWIVNLVNRQVEVYTDPTGPAEQPAYRQRQDFPVGTSVPVQISGQVAGMIAVQELLP
jgi:Uma2 family endonuclease